MAIVFHHSELDSVRILPLRSQQWGVTRGGITIPSPRIPLSLDWFGPKGP